MKFEHFSLIKYAKHLKGNESIDDFYGYTHKYVDRSFEGFSIDDFAHNNGRFEKWVPANTPDRYIFITKEDTSFKQKVRELFYKLLGIQSFLLGIFAVLSFLLAKNALAPLRKNIEKLDRFAKDLIHDLNTPVTSIGLNLKLLSKDPLLKGHKALKRLQQSANDISDLHTNLSFLLKEKKYELENIELKEMIETLLQEYSQLYPKLNFIRVGFEGKVLSNAVALRQILDNLLSNACKYSHDEGTITLSYKDKRLEILDDGIGIKNPERVFERNYTEDNHGSGIGLDIVKRLCDMMRIDISVESTGAGTLVVLEFE